MARFTVVWTNSALAKLAELYLEASDPAVVSRAADHIDVELARRPGAIGTTLSDPVRLLAIEPLEIMYVVQEPDRLVRVVHVRRFTS